MNNTKSQETVKHTALPWAFKKVPVWAPTQPNGNIPVFEFSFAGGDEWMRTAKANTALIVKAVNCHDDLLEACKQAYYSMAKDGGKYIVMAPEKLIAMLESALEKAGAK